MPPDTLHGSAHFSVKVWLTWIVLLGLLVWLGGNALL